MLKKYSLYYALKYLFVLISHWKTLFATFYWCKVYQIKKIVWIHLCTQGKLTENERINNKTKLKIKSR